MNHSFIRFISFRALSRFSQRFLIFSYYFKNEQRCFILKNLKKKKRFDKVFLTKDGWKDKKLFIFYFISYRLIKLLIAQLK